MNELMQVFENSDFGEVRILEEDGRMLFCGNDVAKCLGYARPSKAVLDHCKGVLKRDTLTKGGVQSLKFIPEGDVYRLICNSKLPNAEQFESWVFDEVLPTIRKTGFYGLSTEEQQRQLAREVGKEVRKGLTDSIKECIPESPNKHWAYKNYTNLVYMVIFNKSAKDLREERGVESSFTPLRDYMTPEELQKVKMLEDIVKNYVYAGVEYKQIKALLHMTFPNGVRLALTAK